MKRHTESGTALIVALSFAAVIAAISASAMLVTSHVARNAQRTRAREDAIAVGDAHLEWAFAQWRTLCRAQSNTARPGSDFSNPSLPPASLLKEPANYTISNYHIQAVDEEGETSNGQPARRSGSAPGDSTWGYLASVDVTVPTISRTPVVTKIRRAFEKRLESPWKNAIFYTDMLEIHPSPKFTVTGRVKTNDWLYASPDGGNSLTFNDSVEYTKGYKQGYAPVEYRSAKTGAENTFAPGRPPFQSQREDPFGISPAQFNTTDTNPNNDGYRELIERPDSKYPETFTDSSGNNPRFYNTASVKVLVDANNKLTIMDGSGTILSSSTGTAAERAMYNAVNGAISTNQTIKDFREAAPSVRLTTIDVGLLKTAVSGNKIPGWNGVVYISDTSADQNGGNPKRGIRLKNGTSLPTGGLTVVSDNPIYVQGDYNTSGQRQPAAVIGDAVNILSNNWSDANSSADSTSSRSAKDTTVNTAILSGIVPSDSKFSGSDSYSGGAENFPRFHEDWSGKTFTYNGSMVQLFVSKQGKGRWSSASYNPPIRNWYFETMFLTTPPPGTFFTNDYVKGRWYMEND